MFYFVSLIVFALDRAVKFLVVKTLEPVGSVQFLKSPLYFTYVSNTGVAFGFFRDHRAALIVIGMIVCAVVAYFYMKSNRNDTFFILALALIMGGSLGNLFDRVVFGYVIDYIDLKFFAVFNLADMAINVGVLLILFEIFRGSKCIQ